MIAANNKVRNFLRIRRNAAYVDVYRPMMKPDGDVMGEIFRSDSLHMNEKGYAIWQKVLQPYLLKDKSKTTTVNN
jgi:hypothetical protein